MTQPESRKSREISASIRARGGFVFKVHGSSLMMNGVPDLVGCYKGYFFGLETKMEDNDLSPVQRLRARQIKAAGGIAVTVRSVRDAMDVLDTIDALEAN